MIRLSYSAPQKLAKLAAKAAVAWNRALAGVVSIAPPTRYQDAPHVAIMFGRVDRTHDFERVAEHQQWPSGGHTIILANDVQWQITRWQRWLGLGEQDAYAALLHEFGHALGLPHSDAYGDVMASTLGTTVISGAEAAGYRRFLIAKHDLLPMRTPQLANI